MKEILSTQIETLLGQPPKRITPLSGGSIGEVYRVDMADRAIVAKVADGTGLTLEPEGYMLNYIKEHSQLPVPTVLHSSPSMLLMEFIEGSSNLNVSSERHAAELLADLHNIRGTRFGLERPTLIGSLPQPNSPSDSWLAYFRDQRLLHMAREAEKANRLPTNIRQRIERLSEQLDKWILEPPYPSLIHGDMWTTNILAKNGRITAFLDPAIYYANPEIELAFSTLFNTFGQAFFQRYHEIRPIVPGFFEERRDLYNLYPLLVHVRLFGGGYVGAVDSILRKFGF